MTTNETGTSLAEFDKNQSDNGEADYFALLKRAKQIERQRDEWREMAGELAGAFPKIIAEFESMKYLRPNEDICEASYNQAIDNLIAVVESAEALAVYEALKGKQ